MSPESKALKRYPGAVSKFVTNWGMWIIVTGKNEMIGCGSTPFNAWDDVKFTRGNRCWIVGTVD